MRARRASACRPEQPVRGVTGRAVGHERRRNAADGQSVPGGRQRSARGSPRDRVGRPREGVGRLRRRWRSGKRVLSGSPGSTPGGGGVGSVCERRAGGLDRRAELHRRCDEGQKRPGAGLLGRKVARERRSSLSTARSSAALYGQSSTFTKLPSVGQVFARGQSLYAIGGQSVVLLYGSVLPTRAFVAGMSAGPDVAELNANLDALGYGQGLVGDTFSAATGAAIRALQSAHGLTVTGELLLGSVVFEPGPVRVTSVTPTVGADRHAGTGARYHLDRSPGQARARRGPAGRVSRRAIRSRSPCPTTRPRRGESPMSRASRHRHQAKPAKKKARPRSKSMPHRQIPRRRVALTRHR